MKRDIWGCHLGFLSPQSDILIHWIRGSIDNWQQARDPISSKSIISKKKQKKKTENKSELPLLGLVLQLAHLVFHPCAMTHSEWGIKPTFIPPPCKHTTSIFVVRVGGTGMIHGHLWWKMHKTLRGGINFLQTFKPSWCNGWKITIRRLLTGMVGGACSVLSISPERPLNVIPLLATLQLNLSSGSFSLSFFLS